MKYRDQINKPEVTEEIAIKIQEKDFINLLQEIDHELSEFYSIFTSVRWEPSVAKCQSSNNFYFANIYFSKEFNRIKSSFIIQIGLTIQQFLYRMEVVYIKDIEGIPLYKKELPYTDFITEQDQTDIINVIGNYLNQFIETHGFTNKML